MVATYSRAPGQPEQNASAAAIEALSACLHTAFMATLAPVRPTTTPVPPEASPAWVTAFAVSSPAAHSHRLTQLSAHIAAVTGVGCPTIDTMVVSTSGILESLVTSVEAMQVGLPDVSGKQSLNARVAKELEVGQDACLQVSTAYTGFDNSLAAGVDAAALLAARLPVQEVSEVRTFMDIVLTACDEEAGALRSAAAAAGEGINGTAGPAETHWAAAYADGDGVVDIARALQVAGGGRRLKHVPGQRANMAALPGRVLLAKKSPLVRVQGLQ